MPNAEHSPLLPRAVNAATRFSESQLDDFKEFINRGKVVDLAVGVVIGAAFSAIVSSLVDDLLSPFLSLIAGHQLENAFIILKKPDPNSEACQKHPDYCTNPKTPKHAQEVGAVTFNYGEFINRIINFFLVALMLFFIVKAYTKLAKKRSKFLKRHRDCPYCTEEIPEKARRCKYCCSDVEPLDHGVPISQNGGASQRPR